MEFNKRVIRTWTVGALAGAVLGVGLGMSGVTGVGSQTAARDMWMNDPAYNQTDGLVDYGNVNHGLNQG